MGGLRVEAALQASAAEMDRFYRRYGLRAHIDGRHAEIAKLCVGPKVLDVGCGTGDLLAELQRKQPGWTLYGTDISAVALNMARGRGVKASLQQRSSLPEGRFDTVVLSQVLEHVDGQIGDRLLVQAARFGRRLIVSVPNEGRVKSRYHVRVFTVNSLRKALGKLGAVMIHPWRGERKRIIAVVTVSEGRR